MEHTFYKMTFGKSIFCDFSVLTESSILVKCKSYVRDRVGRVDSGLRSAGTTWSHIVWWATFGFVWYFTQTQQLRWGYLANACNLFNGFVFILIECSHIFKGTAKTATFNEKRSIISFYIKLNSNHPRSAFRKLKEHITINTIFTFLPSPTTAATTPSYQANIFVKVSLSVTKTKFTKFRPKDYIIVRLEGDLKQCWG